MFIDMSRRHLHLVLAATAVVVWACDDSGSGGDGGSPAGSTGAGVEDTSDSSEPTSDPSDDTTTDDPSDGTDDPEPTGATGVTAEDVLESLADNVFAPTHVEFSDAADALVAATQAYSDAVAGGDGSAEFADLETAYAAAMMAWQRVELLQLGPAAGSSGVAGEFLRDEVYSWPAVNTCRIDQELVLGEYDAGNFTQTRLVNVYGFDAMEYLLFRDSSENTCPPQLPINGEGEWAAIGAEELVARKAVYAVTLAVSIAAVADTLEETWAEGGSWHGYLTDPSSGPLESTQIAMDEVLRAMFYIDKTLKDTKIAVPAGLKDCSADVCLDEVESLYAGLSKEQAIANLEGFERLFWAGASADDGVGFDDLLSSVGEGGLGADMLGDAQAAKDTLAAVEGTFVQALAADGAALDASHAAVVALTDDLKGDFPTVLMLNIPSEAAGDAD